MDKIKKLIEAREITEIELIKRKINELIEGYNEIMERLECNTLGKIYDDKRRSK